MVRPGKGYDRTEWGLPPSNELDRLTHELDEARAQMIATDQVLTAVGRRRRPRLRAGHGRGERATLCHADVAQIHLLDGDIYRLVAAAVGHTDGVPGLRLRNHIALDDGSLIGRVGARSAGPADRGRAR